MQQLPEALRPFAAYRQFIIYRAIPKENGKTQKLPLDPSTLQAFPKGSDWQNDPTKWADAESAIAVANACGPDYGVGFLFRADDPFFFLDIDGAWSGEAWSPVATQLCQMFAGAAVEVSQSGTGLHIFGTGTLPPHSCRNQALGLELYHEGRFVALTGMNTMGSASFDCSAVLPSLVAGYFNPSAGAGDTLAEWTDSPAAEWSGPADDDELIAKALGAQRSAAAVFGGGAGFAALWNCDADALAVSYPDSGSQVRAFDASQADAALAQHLAFWTGKDCERMLRLMKRSALVRDKWEREDYLHRTILRAVSLQRQVYNNTTGTNSLADNSRADQLGAPKLRASSDAQRVYAEQIRAEKLTMCGDDTELATRLAQGGTTAKFWLDNQDRTPQELAVILTPVDSVASPFGSSVEPEIVGGYQFLTPDLQIEHFRGCVYIQDQHRIFTPTGSLLREGQFNATYGGYVFQMDDSREKTTRKAWEAFTESQLVRFPKAESVCFRPALPTGEVIEDEGRRLVNIYVPVPIRAERGDPAPFLAHLEKLLPNKTDRETLLAYMAACVQFPGVKFQWAPLLQGAPGNGKTLFTRCISAAIGKRYTHYPKASDLVNKFNSWILNKIFIGVEDIYVPDHMAEMIETLKPMITGDGLEIQGKGVDQFTAFDICANFMFNMNKRDGMRKTLDDRRFAVFFTAQQCREDILAHGMGGQYFPDLYNWLKGEGRFANLGAGYGYAVVADFLRSYAIPDELNPATKCHRAPDTSTTNEAIAASLGSVEQEILEAIEESRPGFAGGWVSSFALDKLLHSQRMARAIPQNKRRDLLIGLGYDWHPGLKDGRVNNPTTTDAGKPRLFIQRGHIHANLTRPSEIVKHYDEAQSTGIKSDAERAFGG